MRPLRLPGARRPSDAQVRAVGSVRARNIAGAWRIWAAGAAVYLVAMLHRTSLSVAGLAAADRFEISAAQLSTFTVLQLLVYAGMQLPIGVLLDRYGSRRLLAVGLALMTIGQLGFAFVSSYPLALATRVLVGLGDATAFLSVLRLAAVWFPAARNPLLTQLTSLSGQAGALVTAIPMAHTLARFGWVPTYVGAALIGLLSGIALYLWVIDAAPPPAHDAQPAPHPPLLASLRESWADAGTRYGAWAYFSGMFLPNALLLLWGYPWLVEGEGVSPMRAPVLLTLLTVASMASGPLVGALAGRWPRLRQPLFNGLLAAPMMLWTAIALWPGTAPHWLLGALMATAGSGFSGAMLAFDFARAASPPQRIGTALALVNVGGFASTVPMVLGVGVVLDWANPGDVPSLAPHAYRWAMGLPYLLWGIGLVQMVRTRAALARDGTIHPAFE